MATQTEIRLSQKRKRKGILVPLLEDLLQKPLEIENSRDADFIHILMLKQIEREERRSLNGMYGPSSLAGCLRQVYLARNHKEHDIKRVAHLRIEPNFYFLTGNWLHIKWQFALFKLNDLLPDSEFHLWGLEVPVTSKRGDHGGTLDALVRIRGEYYVVDFKGWNVRDFRRCCSGEVSLDAKIQVSDYIMLANVDRTLRVPKIERGLLVVENKGGPDKDHPIALTEVEINASEHLPEIKSRMEMLRQHEKENSIPEIECVSTKSIQFQGCPFHKHCRQEVKAVESRDAKGRESEILTPRRSNRPRRSRPGK